MTSFFNYLILPLLISSVTGQQLISLSNLKGGNVQNFLKNEDDCSLYVSASSDDDAILAAIQVVSGNNQISLRDMKYRRFPEHSGILQPYQIQPNSYITTGLATEKLANLGGVLYYNTAAQLQNLLFYVVTVDSAQPIDVTTFGAVNTTVVFLNTNTAAVPNLSTKITNWSQDKDATASIYQGIPQDGLEPINTQIFSNPMHSDGFVGHFENVEPFSLSSVAFYLKTFKGCSFNIEPGTVSLDGTTTTAFTTTGFYMKPLGDVDASIRIKTLKDVKSLGLIGANILGSAPAGGEVSFLVNDGAKVLGSETTIPADFFAPWSTQNVASDIVISSKGTKMGRYFVQYCVVQGPGPFSTVTPTTTKHVETTTKLSATHSMILMILFSMISCATLMTH